LVLEEGKGKQLQWLHFLIPSCKGNVFFHEKSVKQDSPEFLHKIQKKRGKYYKQ
jgi:hypothetical protein